MDPITIVYKIQKLLKEGINQIQETYTSGSVDNMEKYKYLLGKAHALQINVGAKELDNDTQDEYKFVFLSLLFSFLFEAAICACEFFMLSSLCGIIERLGRNVDLLFQKKT